MRPVLILLLLALSSISLCEKKKIIYLIRHGETNFNTDPVPRVRGRINVPLNDEGIAHCKAAGDFLANENIGKIYYSAIPRAKQSAECVRDHHNGPVEMIEEPLVIDISWGIYEGKTYQEAFGDETGGDLIHHPEKLIPLTLTNILRGKNIPVYGDGKQIRDWLFVTDHCYGIDLVLKKGRLGESYNIGGINEWANIDIVNLLCEQIDQLFADNKEYCIQYPDCPCSKGQSAKTLITHVTDRLGHDRRYAIDAHKIMTELGYKPKDSFETGIAKTIRWYLDHHEWWFKLVK